MDLPGIDRSQFDDHLGPNITPIPCEMHPTGPLYREQTDLKKLPKVNFITGRVFLPAPIVRGDPEKDNPVKYRNRTISSAYFGGDTAGYGGELDAGFNGDPIIKDGGPYWRPFLKGAKSDEKIPDIIRIPANTSVDFAMYISQDNKVHFVFTTEAYIFGSISAPRPAFKQLITREVVYTPPAGTWKFQGTNQVIKLMTTLALDKTVDMSVEPNNALALSGVKWFNIKVGFNDEKLTVNDAIAKLSKKGVAWDSVRAKSLDCTEPKDIVKPTSNNSAALTLRVEASSNVPPKSQKIILLGKYGDTLTGKYLLKNTGVSKSVLTYRSIPLGSTDMLSGALSGGQSSEIPYSFHCEPNGDPRSSTVYKKSFNLYYSLNETLFSMADFADSKDKEYMDKYGKYFNVQSKEIPLKYERENLYKSGNLLFYTYPIEIEITCTPLKIYQQFKIISLDIYNKVNAVKEESVNLQVLTDTLTPTGQFAFKPKDNIIITSLNNATSSIQPLSILVNPTANVTPSASTIQGINNQITVKAQCGSFPDVTPFTFDVVDPTGNTDPTTFTVTLHCYAPHMTDPTPNPLALKGKVGQTAQGAFTFQNQTDAMPDGTQVPLNFTVSSPTLQASAPTTQLAGGDTATVNVSYLCKEPGTTQHQVALTSDDPQRPSANVDVSVQCEGVPHLSGPTPLSIKRQLQGLESSTENITFTNTGTAPLQYSFLSYQTPYVTFPQNTQYASSLLPGESATIQAKFECPWALRDEKGQFKLQTNDPENPLSIIGVDVNCQISYPSNHVNDPTGYRKNEPKELLDVQQKYYYPPQMNTDQVATQDTVQASWVGYSLLDYSPQFNINYSICGKWSNLTLSENSLPGFLKMIQDLIDDRVHYCEYPPFLKH
ncbi:hypothetical protein [Deinococcus maricopensis]|nr:hypothetical protein [Deinococcus maricopensis]